MPASNNYTLIKLMRGTTAESDAWKPEVGEPLLDTESGTLRFGDITGKKGGVPVNTVTTRELQTPVNLDRVIVWGRYYLNGDIMGLPEDIKSPTRLILEVQSSDLVKNEIIQKIFLFDIPSGAKIFTRISTDRGATWKPWLEKNRNAVREPDLPNPNPNTYLEPGTYYIEDMINSPTGISGCDAFLFVYRKNIKSPYIYQFAYLTNCSNNDGRLFVRYSRNGGTSWVSSIYSGWYELTDFLNKMLTNPTTILKKEHGGTERNNGTVWQSDDALKTYYDVSPCASNCVTQSSGCIDTTKLVRCPTDYVPKCPMDGAIEPPKTCTLHGLST